MITFYLPRASGKTHQAAYWANQEENRWVLTSGDRMSETVRNQPDGTKRAISVDEFTTGKISIPSGSEIWIDELELVLNELFKSESCTVAGIMISDENAKLYTKENVPYEIKAMIDNTEKYVKDNGLDKMISNNQLEFDFDIKNKEK